MGPHDYSLYNKRTQKLHKRAAILEATTAAIAATALFAFFFV